MGLKEYRRKRDFQATPEPSGNGEASAPGRQFVVQKHAARRLHYDFRLELDGTLKSWAVPKGPSLDPGVKALAVQVEDHPLDYASFEGVIPKGQYGGGTVMVWDHGIWEPEEDPKKGIRTGKLKFRLFGDKLRGSWSLVRMGGSAGDGGKNWLLIKRDDKEARKSFDLLAKKPKSVVSGRDMDQIAEDADRVWSSNGQAGKKKTAASRKPRSRKAAQVIKASDVAKLSGARRAKQPATMKPQLATLAAEVPTGDDWLHELKFDGYRLLSFINTDGTRLITRNGNDWTDRFSTIAKELKSLRVSSAVLDGEVVLLTREGIADFQHLQNLLKHGDLDALVYYVFDVPYLEGFDLTKTPLVERKELLARLIKSHSPGNDGVLRYSDHIQGEGANVMEHACRAAMEGIVSKRGDSPYEHRRSRSWLKVKCLKRQEFVIGGYTRPSGSRVGFGALLLGYHEAGELKYCGRVGTGFSTDSLRQLKAELAKRKIDAQPFKSRLTGTQRKGVTWIKPELVCEVEFTEWTDEGLLRHPSFQGLREDKPAKQIVREDKRMVVDAGEANGGQKKTKAVMRKKSPVTKRNNSSVAGVKISHPDRVVYPQQGVTKLDLARFYESIADWVLPHVTGRPLTLVRCPEGRAGDCFFQKHLTGAMPETVRGVKIREKSETREYVVIDDLAGLISLVQMGVLEIHPWPAREDKIERPDRMVFDLDPGEGVRWQAILDAAREVRELLNEMGLESFLRTSGGKGLHVVVPLGRRNTWDELKQFARAVADDMVRRDPKRYIATMSKAKRRGKIFVDYLRNQRGATSIASYSTRAREGAPVATPLGWKELSSDLKPNGYTVVNLEQRLSRLKSDPWKEFFTVRQSITASMQKVFD